LAHCQLPHEQPLEHVLIKVPQFPQLLPYSTWPGLHDPCPVQLPPQL